MVHYYCFHIHAAVYRFMFFFFPLRNKAIYSDSTREIGIEIVLRFLPAIFYFVPESLYAVITTYGVVLQSEL